jgi:hypothetical protein
MEQQLQPVLESTIQQKLTKTIRRFDTIDFKSPTHAVELKCRCAVDKYGRPVTHTTYDEWLLPACKVGRHPGLEEVCFYYFEGDASLWMIHHKDIDWKQIRCEIPWHHPEKQLHYYVPAHLWKRIQ